MNRSEPATAQRIELVESSLGFLLESADRFRRQGPFELDDHARLVNQDQQRPAARTILVEARRLGPIDGSRKPFFKSQAFNPFRLGA